MPTHYEVLGVHPTSEQEVIDAAYKALIRKYHPDRAGDNERIRQINAAYSILKNPLKRRAYDATLKLFPSKELTVHERKRAEHGTGAKAPGPAPGRQEKKCPDCFENVAAGALVCRYCGHRFVERRESLIDRLRGGCGFAVALIILIAVLGMLAGGDGAVSNELAGPTEATACGPDSVELDLGRTKAEGTIELLAPKPDTDAHNQVVVGLNSGTCVSRAEIDELVRASGESGAVKLLIGHDPSGSLYDFRSRSAYEPDGVTPLSEMPPVPGDMHFGEASWDVKSNSPRLVVSWYGNFQQWLERNYGEANAAKADDPAVGQSGDPQYAASSAPKVPAQYRGRWAMSAADCQYTAMGGIKLITEAGDMGRASGDLESVNELTPLSARMTFSMADDKGPFSYTEQWTITPDRSQLIVDSIEDGLSRTFIRCPARD